MLGDSDIGALSKLWGLPGVCGGNTIHLSGGPVTMNSSIWPSTNTSRTHERAA